MFRTVLFVRQHAVSCRHAVYWLSSLSRVAAPTCESLTSSLLVPCTSDPKILSSQMKDACNLPSTIHCNEIERQHLYQHLSAGYQLPTVWYNTVMKKSIIDPLLNFKEYDLPMVPGHGERKEVPGGHTSVTPIEDPGQGELAKKMALHLLIIRRKKMKKHKRKKLKKRMRFVMRRRRQLKQKRREREIQKYEREQIKFGQVFSAEQYVDEHLALARKSGWHIDIIAEFNRKREKEGTEASSTPAADNSRKH